MMNPILTLFSAKSIFIQILFSPIFRWLCVYVWGSFFKNICWDTSLDSHPLTAALLMRMRFYQNPHPTPRNYHIFILFKCSIWYQISITFSHICQCFFFSIRICIQNLKSSCSIEYSWVHYWFIQIFSLENPCVTFFTTDPLESGFSKKKISNNDGKKEEVEELTWITQFKFLYQPKFNCSDFINLMLTSHLLFFSIFTSQLNFNHISSQFFSFCVICSEKNSQNSAGNSKCTSSQSTLESINYWLPFLLFLMFFEDLILNYNGVWRLIFRAMEEFR